MTMFLEGGKGTPMSMRRVLAFLIAISGIGLLWFSSSRGEAGKWGIIAGVASLLTSLMYMICTTVADIVALAQAAKGLGK
jgi:hypothetical protein